MTNMIRSLRLPSLLALLAWGAVSVDRSQAAEPPVFSSEIAPSPVAPPAGMVLTTPQISSEIPGVLRDLHVQLSKGLKPAENAVIWLMQIYGEEALDAPLHDVTLEMLGIEKMPAESPLFVSVDQYVQSLNLTVEQRGETAGIVDEQLREGSQGLWTAQEKPELAGYLRANEKALNTLLVAANRPRYFAPLLAPELPSRLMSASLVVERRLPFLARMLAARAVLQFSEDNLDGTLADLRACHRLANLLANGSPFDVSVAKAQVIDSTAFWAERALLECGQLTGPQLAQLQHGLTDSLSRFPSVAMAAAIGERALLHQEIELLKTDPESRIGFFEESEHKTVDPAQLMSLADCDWKLAYRRADEIQDAIVAALRVKDRNSQQALFSKLDQAYAEWEATVDQKTVNFSEEIQKDRDSASRWVGENMAMSLRPNYYQRRASADRQEVRRDLVTIGIALERYQREKGEFPAALENLVPEYLGLIPADACTDAPFIYSRLAADQARLISLGRNRVDDAGKIYNDDVELKLR